jgi:hypothetical protein
MDELFAAIAQPGALERIKSRPTIPFRFAEFLIPQRLEVVRDVLLAANPQAIPPDDARNLRTRRSNWPYAPGNRCARLQEFVNPRDEFGSLVWPLRPCLAELTTFGFANQIKCG